MTQGDGLSKGRRSDLARAQREASIGAAPLDAGTAADFAAHYARAMDEKQAPDRWRRSPAFFAALVDGSTFITRAETAAGGASAVFLVAHRRASYAFSVRWGSAATTSTLALHEGCRALSARGVDTMTLGGGVGDAAADSLLAFKRSWGGTGLRFRIGARAYVPDAHAELVAAGRARPLPAGTVPP